MSESNELKEYIDKKLESNFIKTATLKKEDSSEIYLYEHKTLNNKIIKRVSTNRNDEVFRKLRNKRINNMEQIYEVCSTEDNLIVLEEFIEGKTLLQLIDEGPIPTKKACKYAYDVCNALKVLHDMGIVHRDVNPSNIIINNEDEAVLIDLGIARILKSDGGRDTNELGTVGYAAPEQYGISQSGKSADTYSLGITLNIMITGIHPTVGVAKGKIGRIINKSISTQISKRYLDARQLQRDLKFYI